MLWLMEGHDPGEGKAVSHRSWTAIETGIELRNSASDASTGDDSGPSRGSAETALK
jgi:hypothetical protein